MEEGGAEDEVMCLQKSLQPGVRSCSWKPSGQPDPSHTKHTHHRPFYLSLIFLLHFKLTLCAFFLPFYFSQPLSPFHHFTFATPPLFLLFFSLKENILLINAWQLQGAVLLHFSMATASLFQWIPLQFW